MPNAQNVVAGKPLATGGVLMGDLNVAAPTDATTALNAGFLAAGYIGEDGVTETVDRSTEKIKAWGTDTVKVLQTDFSTTYQFTFLEVLDANVLKAVYGTSNVTTTAPTTTKGTLHAVKVNAETLPQRSFVFEIKDGLSKVRIYVPKGQITELGEVTYNDGEVVGFQVTVEAFRHEALNANAIKYLDNGITTAV